MSKKIAMPFREHQDDDRQEVRGKSSARSLRILSIAHTAVNYRMGRQRYAAIDPSANLDVHLLGPRRWYEHGREYVADGEGLPNITVHFESVVLGKLPGAKWYGHFYPRLPALIRKIRPDVIHLWEEPWAVVAMEAMLFRGDAALVLEVDQNVLRRLPPPFETIRRAVLKRTDVVLSRTPAATEVVRACGYKGPALPIGYGVDTSLFRAKDLSRDSYGAGRRLRVGYAGRLVEEKGLDDVLSAMALAKNQVDLSIMGEGPYAEAIYRKIAELHVEDRVSIRGWGSYADVADFYRSMDVSVLPTRTVPVYAEQFGRAIIESQSCGTPVIGSTCGAIPDVVGRGGWIFPERDPQALAEIFDRIARSPDEVRTMAHDGIKNVEARFTYAAIARDLIAGWRAAANLKGASKEGIGTALQQSRR